MKYYSLVVSGNPFNDVLREKAYYRRGLVRMRQKNEQEGIKDLEKVMEQAAVNLADGDFGARAPVEGTDGVSELSSTFNYMAANLQQAQRRERDFLMSVGHDLRTPLTTISSSTVGRSSRASREI